MKKRWLLTIVLALAVGVGACGDDDGGTANNGTNNDTQDAGLDGDMSDGGGQDGGQQDGGQQDGGQDDGGQQDGGDNDATPSANNTVSADDQVLDAAASNEVTIASVHLENDGFVVIHEDDNGAPGAVIGHHQAQAGDNADIVVTLDRNVENGETLYAMLHDDSNSNDTYDFVSAGDEDGPLLDGNGDPITDSFMVNVPSISASDLTLSDLSTVVSVDAAFSNGPGFVVIHENACTDDNGDPTFGDVIGYAAVSDAANSDISITLDRPAADGEDLCAMLHTDTGTTGTYEFDGSAGSDDGPVVLADDSIVMDSFNVSVDEGIPAIRITLSANGSQDYTVDSVEPAMYDDGLSGSNDPTLQLKDGWRYEIDNTAMAGHPLEFYGIGTLGGDIILLSQVSGEDASAEGDADINWVEDGNKVRFNVAGLFTAGTLANPKIEFYRCHNHPDAMKGEISVQ